MVFTDIMIEMKNFKKFLRSNLIDTKLNTKSLFSFVNPALTKDKDCPFFLALIVIFIPSLSNYSLVILSLIMFTMNMIIID